MYEPRSPLLCQKLEGARLNKDKPQSSLVLNISLTRKAVLLMSIRLFWHRGPRLFFLMISKILNLAGEQEI